MSEKTLLEHDGDDFIADAIDAWRKMYPNLTVVQVLEALERIRYKLTEGLIEHSDDSRRD